MGARQAADSRAPEATEPAGRRRIDLATPQPPGAKTLREIYAQAAAWRTVAQVLPDLGPVAPAFQPAPDEVVFAGCGSSYYLALAAAACFQRVAGIRSTAAPASEVILFPETALPSNRRALV